MNRNQLKFYDLKYIHCLNTGHLGKKKHIFKRILEGKIHTYVDIKTEQLRKKF